MQKSWFLIPLCTLALTPAGADSITLVTGEKITGTIRSQTDTEVTIEVPVSATITDERTFRKDEVQKIDKDQPDEIAFKALGQTLPDAQFSFALPVYTEVLAPLYAFEAQYPNSSHLAEVKERIAQFEAEKQKVAAGQIKYLGQWLSKEDAAQRQVQISGHQTLQAMQKEAAAGDYLEAMRTFSALEKNYQYTRSYPAAVTLALQVLERLSAQLTNRAQAIAADQAQLKQTMADTQEPERSHLLEKAKAEQAYDDVAIQQALKQGETWVPLIPRGVLSITTLQKAVAAAYPRLKSVPVAAMTQSLAKVDEARQAISVEDYKTADAALKAASQLWAQNESAHYWTERLKERMATPTPTPLPRGTPKPTPKPTPRHTPLSSSGGASGSSGETGQAGGDKSFFLTPLGMSSTALVVLALLGWGATTLRNRGTTNTTNE